jgi:hypothetical protein
MFNLSNNNVMKTFRFFLINALLSAAFSAMSQKLILPDVKIYTLEGSTASASSIDAKNSTTVLFFWNADDNRSIEQLRLLNEEYENQIFSGKVKIVGICTNYSCTMQSIRPLVSGLAIGFDVFIDRNNDLKRAMNIPVLPYTMIIDHALDVHRYSGYCNNIVGTIMDLNNNGMANISDKR